MGVYCRLLPFVEGRENVGKKGRVSTSQNSMLNSFPEEQMIYPSAKTWLSAFSSPLFMLFEKNLFKSAFIGIASFTKQMFFFFFFGLFPLTLRDLRSA